MAIYKQGENWYIDFRFKGQRIRESIRPSWKDAEKVIAKRKTEIVENKYLDIRKEPDPIKFHDFAKEYLQWDEVNFEQGVIALLDTKNHERRDIPMNETVKATLKEIERKGGYVFSYGNGRRFTKLQHSSEKALKKSGIEDFRFHDLRHCFASNLVMAGVDLNTVRELMGHKDLTMTLRYSHLAPNYKTKAVNILDQFMSQNPPKKKSLKKSFQ